MRVEVDASQAKVEELTAKVKTLEQENLAKAQEITSLSHRNQLLEAEVEKRPCRGECNYWKMRRRRQTRI